MDIHGGKAVIDGPQNYLGNLYRSVPVGITVEGANILTRNLIVFGQGAIRAHPYLLEEMNALRRRRPRPRPRCLRQGVLEACRPQLQDAVPRLGPELDRRPVRARARCRRRDRLLSPALALFGGLCAVCRHGAADARRRAEAQGDAVGAVRRYPLRALSALGRAEALAGRGPAEGGFRRARMVHGQRLQDDRELALRKSSPICPTASSRCS